MRKLTKKQIERLALEIRRFLLNRDMWVDVTIYFNGKAISTDDRNGNFGYNDPDKLFILENMNPRDYFLYAGDILSMSFEGDFYDVLNYDCWPAAKKHFEDLLSKYGLYYVLGNSWNLTVAMKG